MSICKARHGRATVEQLLEHLDDRWAAGRPQAEKQPYWKRPASALLTLHPEMSRAEALAIFRKYNSMTQVELGGAWFYVTAIGTGTASLPCEVQRLSPTRALYRVMDGHLRLHIHPMEVRT